MSATVSIITNPDNLSPILNSPVWFRLDSASSSVSNFKYVVRLNKQSEPFTSTFDDLQIYKLPPRPSGECEYTPHKMLESFFGYKPTPFINNWTASNDALIRYNINYGFEYNPNISFTGTFNSGGFLGLSFSSNPSLNVGDIIRLNKANKQVNIGYDGFSTVTGTGSNSVVLNLSFGTTQSNETGTINSLLRLNATSSNYEAIYGTRQYDERTRDFTDEYIIGLNQRAMFLTENAQRYKPTLIDDYETLSMVLSATQGHRIFLNLYDVSNNLLNTYSYTQPINGYKRVDFGVGPQNIMNNLGTSSVFFSGVDNYRIYVRNDYSINVDYTIGTYSFEDDIIFYGIYNGVPYYTWSDDLGTRFVWYSTANQWWEVSNSLGGGNQYLTTNTNLDDVPPTGSTSSGDWFVGSSPLFTTFTLTNNSIISEYKRYKFVDNCSLADNVRLVWLNRLGGWDYFNFTLGGKESISVERNTYKKVLPYNYSIGDRQDTTYAQKAEEVWSIQSNWISEEESEWLSGLIESREVYHIVGTDIYPIQILDKTYQVKSVVRDQIFNLSIQFKYAFNKVI